MTTPANTAMSGLTVNYGPVQFGGSDAGSIAIAGDPGMSDMATVLKGLPPMYAIRSQFRYDDSNRTIIGVDYHLTVRCVFHGANNTQLAQNMTSLRKYLSLPRQILRIEGLGTGIGKISTTAGNAGIPANTMDISYGPKPLSLSMEPVGGQLAWELTWEVAFFVGEHISVTDNDGRLSFWMAFNSSSTWSNDFEGIPTRSVQGYIQIAQGTTNTKSPPRLVDSIREAINIVCPVNFRRVQNVWRMNEAQDHLVFSVIDEYLPGDNLPAGITMGGGSFNITANAGQDNLGMNVAHASLQMILKVAPGQHPSLAAFYFMSIYLTKQAKLTSLDNNGKARNVVLPVHFSVTTQYFDNQRVIQCAGAWQITNSITVVNGVAKNENGQTVSSAYAGINGILSAADLFTPVSDQLTDAIGSPQGYKTWRASVFNLWSNRGTPQIVEITGGSNPSVYIEGSIVDLGSQIVSGTIGEINQIPLTYSASNLPTMGCPAIPEKGGWISYRRRIDFWLEEYQSTHRRAISYIPSSSAGWQGQTDPGETNVIHIETGAPMPYDTPQHVSEYHGRPRLFVGISVASLRFKRMPYLHKVKSVGGYPVKRIKAYNLTPYYAFNAFGCPVYRQQGYVIYEVLGFPSSISRKGQPMESDVEFSENELEL